MIKIAVCDDNKVFLELLCRIIETKFGENNLDCEIIKYVSGAAFMEHHKKDPFDIVFLDIVMPDMEGFRVAKEIRKKSEKTYIIFVTAVRDYVYDVFDFSPFDFVPKDIPQYLENKVEKVIKRLGEHLVAYKRICFDISFGEKKYIEPNEIVCVQSHANYVDYYIITGEKLHLRGKIDDALGVLSPRIFVRIHNRTIVNMVHIIRPDYPNNEVIMDNGKTMGISRTYKNEFVMRYAKFNQDFR